MIISRAQRLNGTVTVPGDKSISHRAAILAALAGGESEIRNFSSGVDCLSTLECLRALGVAIETRGSTVVITGGGKSGLTAPTRDLDCGNSGTTMRLLAGILASQSFDSVLTGDESLLRRTMTRIIEPLSAMGGRIESADGRPPLRISGVDGLSAIEYRLSVSSAQVKSAVLLAGLYANGRTMVIEREATRDHTERMLPAFGVDLTIRALAGGCGITVEGSSHLRPTEISVPGDVSSAAFLIAAAACLIGSELTIQNVGINPTRTAFLDLLRSLGANIAITGRGEASGEPLGDILVRAGLSRNAPAPLISGRMVTDLIDEIPILAVVGTQIDGGVQVRDAVELRKKESDRIASIVENLRRMNATVEEFDDGFRVHRSELCGAVVDSFGDHRIAMAFSVAGLFAKGDTEVLGAQCVDVSFPGFFEVLDTVTVRELSVI